MTAHNELSQLIDNLDESQVNVLSAIALRIARVSAERWTGRIAFELNASQGVIGDTHVNKTEIIRQPKKRRIRSSRG